MENDVLGPNGTPRNQRVKLIFLDIYIQVEIFVGPVKFTRIPK